MFHLNRFQIRFAGFLHPPPNKWLKQRASPHSSPRTPARRQRPAQEAMGTSASSSVFTSGFSSPEHRTTRPHRPPSAKYSMSGYLGFRRIAKYVLDFYRLLQPTHTRSHTHTPPTTRGLSGTPVPAGVLSTFRPEVQERGWGLGQDGMGWDGLSAEHSFDRIHRWRREPNETHVLSGLTLSFCCKCFEKENTLKPHRDTAINISSE